MLNRPLASLTAVFAPCSPVTVTVTPGTTRPCASMTWPEIVPVVCCACAAVATNASSTACINPTQHLIASPRVCHSDRRVIEPTRWKEQGACRVREGAKAWPVMQAEDPARDLSRSFVTYHMSASPALLFRADLTVLAVTMRLTPAES